MHPSKRTAKNAATTKEREAEAHAEMYTQIGRAAEHARKKLMGSVEGEFFEEGSSLRDKKRQDQLPLVCNLVNLADKFPPPPPPPPTQEAADTDLSDDDAIRPARRGDGKPNASTIEMINRRVAEELQKDRRDNDIEFHRLEQALNQAVARIDALENDKKTMQAEIRKYKAVAKASSEQRLSVRPSPVPHHDAQQIATCIAEDDIVPDISDRLTSAEQAIERLDADPFEPSAPVSKLQSWAADQLVKTMYNFDDEIEKLKDWVHENYALSATVSQYRDESEKELTDWVHEEYATLDTLSQDRLELKEELQNWCK
jgi:hypothetical protein